MRVTYSRRPYVQSEWRSYPGERPLRHGVVIRATIFDEDGSVSDLVEYLATNARVAKRRAVECIRAILD